MLEVKGITPQESLQFCIEADIGLLERLRTHPALVKVYSSEQSGNILKLKIQWEDNNEGNQDTTSKS